MNCGLFHPRNRKRRAALGVGDHVPIGDRVQARQRESKIFTRNISSSQLTVIHGILGARNSLFKRTDVITLWICGLFTCTAVGSVIAVQISGDDARLWGAIAGMVAFTSARLWPA